MIKQITVTFSFDSETEEVSDIKVVGSSEKKKTTTKKVKDVVTEIGSTPLITLEANKLVFNSKAVLDMGIQYEDRVLIKWEKLDGKKELVPIIGTDISFGEEGAGNKVTKSNTIAYKGKANTVLAERGTEFTIVEYREGIWRLIPEGTSLSDPENTSLEEAIEKASEVEPVLIEEDEENEIDELQYKL